LNALLTAEGIESILDFSFYPFGNAYFANDADNLPACPAVECTVEGFYSFYNESSQNVSDWTVCTDGLARSCWQASCGPGTKLSKKQCTSGDAVYQHGPGEGLADVVEACAMKSVGGTAHFSKYWDFVFCFEGVELVNAGAYPAMAYGTPKDPTDFESTFGVPASSFLTAINVTMAAAESCAESTGLDFNAIASCADPTVGDDGQLALGKQGTQLEADNAWATVQASMGGSPHTFTPWVVFQGSPILFPNDDDASYADLLSWVCAAYDGKQALPEGCPENPMPIPSEYVDYPSPSPAPTATSSKP
jgi:hypothetical protein